MVVQRPEEQPEQDSVGIRVLGDGEQLQERTEVCRLQLLQGCLRIGDEGGQTGFGVHLCTHGPTKNGGSL